MAVHRPKPEFLEKQLKSILRQTHRNLGVTLVFDGPHPGLADEIHTMTGGDDRVHCEEYPEHCGCCRTFERGLMRFRGRDCLIALADQDDVWDAGKLEILARVFADHPDTLLAFSDSSIIDEFDRVVSPSLHASEERIRTYGITSLMARNCISGHSQVFRSVLLDEAVPFPEDMRGIGLHHDHWLAMVATLRGAIEYIPEILVSHRLHEGNQVGPRFARAGERTTGVAGWCAQNFRLRSALKTRYRLLRRLPEFKDVGFNRLTMLGWSIKSWRGGNTPAAAIYLRAVCAKRRP